MSAAAFVIHAPDVETECEEPDEPALDVLVFRPDYYDLQIAPWTRHS